MPEIYNQLFKGLDKSLKGSIKTFQKHSNILENVGISNCRIKEF
jgi:hypothetical protein